MKEATGVARITFTAGAISRPAQGWAQVRAAKSAPRAAPAAKPPKMRPRLIRAERQKTAVPASSHSRAATASGPGSSSCLPTQRAASCQTPSQKARGMTTFRILAPVRLRDVVEGVIGDGTSDRSGIGRKEHLIVAGNLHQVLPVHIDQIGLGDGSLGHGGLGNDLILLH